MREIFWRITDLRHHYLIVLLLIGLFVSFLESCEKDTLRNNPLPAGDTIKFSTDVVPIFNACIGCHNGTIQTPDLEHDPYQSLINGHYVNVADPTQSIIYIQLTTVPSHIARVTPDQVQIILEWIKQGAKNN